MKIGLLLIDDFALLSYAAFVEPFRAANVLAGTELYRWEHIALDNGQVLASNGARLIADTHINDAVDRDAVFVFAAGNPASFRDEACFAWLRMQARRGIPIGGVSGGPYLLARAGLLGHCRATIHWEHAAALAAEFPHLRLEQGLYVIDGDRMTCAGGSAGLDLALAMIERDHDGLLAQRVAEWFIRPEPRGADDTQRSDLATRHGTANRRLLPMLAAMEQAIEEPASRVALAVRAAVSVRQLERLCQAELGASVGEVYLALRLDRANELLRSTGLSITEVAIACGFRSTSHFSRRFKHRHGRTASSVRRSRQRGAVVPPASHSGVR